MKTQEKITKLAEEYHGLIAGQHHKDKDCHWQIQVRWSYGNAPVFIVSHNGYLHKMEETICGTYEAALAVLRDELKDAIEIERCSIADFPDIRFPDDIPGELRAFEL
jgi:hypothetical protein